MTATRYYLVRDFWGDDTEIRAASAQDAAEKYLDGQEGNTGRKTVFWDLAVARRPIARRGVRPEPSRQDWHTKTVIQHPTPPACVKGRKRHDWEDGQVYASGGGVAYTDTCSRCGARKRVDTWGSHPENGTQGWRVIEYLRPE